MVTNIAILKNIKAIAFLKNQLDGNLLQFHYIITSSDVFTNFSRHSYNYRRK